MLVKTGWTYYEEVANMEKNSVIIIGRLIDVGSLRARDKSMTSPVKKVIGLVLLNKIGLVKFAVSTDTAIRMVNSSIIEDALVVKDRVRTKYETVRKLPKYTNVHDLVTLLDFPDGEMNVCIEENEQGFIVVTAGFSEIKCFNKQTLDERISYFGKDLGLPANVGIYDGQYKFNKLVKGR